MPQPHTLLLFAGASVLLRVAGPEPPFWRNPKGGAINVGKKSGVENSEDGVLSARDGLGGARWSPR
jgi:hypothetical protein